MKFTVGQGLALIAAAAVAAGLFLYTSNKLQRMRMVRGEIEGAQFVEGTVSRKWQGSGKHGPVYWIQFGYVANGSRMSDRTNVEEKLWDSLGPNRPIRLAILPNGDVELPDGIWASDGNMLFDRVLQAGELLGAVLLGLAGAACLYFAARRPRANKLKDAAMTIDDFWAIIGKARAVSGGDDEAFLSEVRAWLKKLPPEEIVSFDVHYDALRFRAYRRELWGAAYLMNGGCSDDGFEYFRAWLISRGKTVYEKALADPDSLAAVCDPESDCHELEELMGLAGEAYEARTGKPLPDRKREFPELTGRDWQEDGLESLYPRISARMSG